jgi:formylglycine-generating enzyme required for sulfatase activity/serine/threonine protein kinase
MSQPMVGRKVGNWVIESRIGAGGMGTVYLARHETLGTSAAVKVLSTDLGDDPKFRERFFQEARTQAQLRHPHIAQVIDFHEQDGAYFLVVEYVDGQALDKIIRAAGGPIEIPRALDWAKQALSALDFAHQKKVIHRDVKPANLLIDGRDQLKVVDFGIAIEIGGRRLTTMSASIGTPPYMSPEQIISPWRIDHRADVYSMGIVLYELLTGRVPFDDPDIVKVQQAQCETPPPPPRTINPAIPAALEAIVLKALEKDPNARYGGCGDFSRAIEAFEQGQEAPDTAGLRAVALPATPRPTPSAAPQPAVAAPVAPRTPQPPVHKATVLEQAPPPSGPARPSLPAPPPARGGASRVLVIVAAVIGGIVLLAVGGLYLLYLIGRVAQRMDSNGTKGKGTLAHGQVRTRTNSADGLEYAWIPSGTFEMGCVPADVDCSEDEAPRHSVRLSRGFWMGRTEVTVAAWRRFASATSYQGPVGATQLSDSDTNQPIVQASWDDAQAYCRWAGGGRLPTEAEWERAARGDREGAKYPWGDAAPVCRTGASSGASFDGCATTSVQPVASYAPNGFGLYDMAGNAAEWCADKYRGHYYASAEAATDPTGATFGMSRVVRGGTSSASATSLRASARGASAPDTRGSNLGFRCALD